MNNVVLPRARARQQIVLLNNVSSPTPRKRKSEVYASVAAMVARHKPVEPVHCLRPHIVEKAARWFLQSFPGEVMYSVKSNPDPRVIGYLSKAGIEHFDTASIAEIELVRKLVPQATLYFMHPVKSREAIELAYFKHGIRHFSLDTHEELEKIMQVTNHAQDLTLYVRLGIPNDKAAMSLYGKFGVSLEQASSLLTATRRAASKLGVCFHVGSQCMDPAAYTAAIEMVGELLSQTGIRLDVMVIGGGFPSIYPGLTPPDLEGYMQAIREGFARLPVSADCKLLCEPGRALVAEAGSLVVRVDLRKGNMLHINDGIYGSLFDAGFPAFRYPVRAMRPNGKFAANYAEFGFFGPTCDSMDAMRGPFLLPADINEGDWIEVGQLGAYGATLRTRFNGFYSDALVEVADQPILSLYSV